MSDPQQATPTASHRRRNVLLAVAAVVLAIAIPIAVLQLLPDGGSETPNGTASSSTTATTPTSSTSATTSPPTSASTTPPFPVIGQVKLQPNSAPSDAAPLIDYALKRQIHTADGTTPLPLTRAYQLVAFVPHAGGWVVLGSHPDGDEGIGRVIDATGQVTTEWLTGHETLARGWDGSTAYVVLDSAQVDAPDGVVVQGWSLPRRGEYRPVGILPDGSLVLNDVARGRVEVGAPATALAVVPGIVAVGGVSITGQVTTLDSIKDAGSCGSMRESLVAEPSWSTCQYTLGRFNPSGSLVIGHPAYRDGIGDWRVSILDATDGTTYVDFTARSTKTSTTFINSVVWEDDTHLLAQVYSSDVGWRILRLGVDGTVTTADLGDIGSDEMDAPVTFVTQP